MSKLGYRPTSFEYSGDADSAFLKRLGKHDYDVGRVEVEKKKWQIIAFIGLGFGLLGLIGMFYGLSLPKNIPLLVKIAPWGEADYVGDISTKNVSAIPDESLKYYIENFVSKTRSVSSDIEVIYANINDAYNFVSSNASNILTEEIKNNKIVERVGSIRTKVTVETTIRLTNESWQVDWVEEDSHINGAVITKRRYRGIYNVKIAPVSTDIIRFNPLGIFIDSYELQEIR